MKYGMSQTVLLAQAHLYNHLYNHNLSPALGTVKGEVIGVLQGFGSEVKQLPTQRRQRRAHTGSSRSSVNQILIC